MVMMLRRDGRELVVIRHPRDTNRNDGAVLDQSIQDPIDAAQTKTRRVDQRDLVRLLDRERAPGVLDRTPDCALLDCITP